jgi:hypothetical protein
MICTEGQRETRSEHMVLRDVTRRVGHPYPTSPLGRGRSGIGGYTVRAQTQSAPPPDRERLGGGWPKTKIPAFAGMTLRLYDRNARETDSPFSSSNGSIQHGCHSSCLSSLALKAFLSRQFPPETDGLRPDGEVSWPSGLNSLNWSEFAFGTACHSRIALMAFSPKFSPPRRICPRGTARKRKARRSGPFRIQKQSEDYLNSLAALKVTL